MSSIPRDFEFRLRCSVTVSRSVSGNYVSAAHAAQPHVQHVQGEVVAVAWLRERTTFRLYGRAIVASDADQHFGQGHGPKIRDENDVPECLDSRNRNRPDAFDQ